jgi:hypothetical protein
MEYMGEKNTHLDGVEKTELQLKVINMVRKRERVTVRSPSRPVGCRNHPQRSADSAVRLVSERE